MAKQIKVREDNYFAVQGWMVTELKLKGNALMLYAIIYGFSQTTNTAFTGSVDYLCEWLGGVSRPTVINTLDNLVKQGLLTKSSTTMKAFCDKAVPLCKKTECTFLMINQLRENIGNPYKPFKIPCGTAIAHACSQILWFTKGSLLDEKYKEVSSGYANPSGNLVSVKVEKNKVTKNDRRLQTYTLNYSTGVDEIKDTLDLAIMLGIISQAGAWFKATLKDGKEQKMQGFNGVQEFYYNDLEELEYLRKQVYEAGMV